MNSQTKINHRTVSMFVLDDCAPDVRVLKLANTLVKNNSKVQIVATHMDKNLAKNETLENGVKIRRINLIMKIPFIVYIEFWIKAIIYFGSQNADIFVCHDLNTLPIGAYFKFKFKNTKLVYDTHEFFPSMLEESKGRFIFWVFASLEKPLIKIPNLVTTISESMAVYIRKYYNLKHPLHYIFNAPNESITNYPIIPLEKSENEVLFAYVGTVSALNRGFELLPEFARHLKSIQKENDPKITIIILGDGAYRKTIQKEIKKAGYDDIIKFLGHHPYDKAMAMSKSCDVGLILTQATSLNNLYSGPNRIFDYLGNELPILATDLYEFKKIAIKEQCGWVIPSANPEKLAEKVLEVAKNKKDILEKKQNVKALFTRKYTWEKMEAKIVELYCK